MRSLRPYLRPCLTFGRAPQTVRLSYLQLFDITQGHKQRSKQRQYRHNSSATAPAAETKRDPVLDQAKQDPPRFRSLLSGMRSAEENGKYQSLWPRMPKQENAMDVKHFRYQFSGIAREQTLETEEVTVRGRLWSIRRAGSRLSFIEVAQDGVKVQCVVNFGNMPVKALAFKGLLNDLHRGDIISVTGHPHRTKSNELSVLAIEMPTLLSRCKQPLPHIVENQETKIRNRHVHLLLDRRVSEVLRLRSELLKFLRQFLSSDGFTDVQTPILADQAGGAVARPFTTTATEFGDRQLSLRIAPELWLKKLVVGGFEKVFEIGPCFRNEGIDLKHNPEFWTCEFYKTYADLDELISMTEHMLFLFSGIARDLQLTHLDALHGRKRVFVVPFPRLDFITTIEREIDMKIPDLSLPDAKEKLYDIFVEKGIPLPASPTLPRLLDQLCSHVLEPHCQDPCWIINHPECMSPLSKSFVHPDHGQIVAARGELFIRAQELVNTYEEENSPVEQRRKFEMQLAYKDPESSQGIVDEEYIQTLEWGMPPTGGWGCGIERLVMLFADTERISHTLSFGTLRHVLAKLPS